MTIAIRALVGAAASAVVLIGVPVLLVRFVGNPLPTTLPTSDQLRFAITRGQVDGWTWVKVFACVAWTAWAAVASGFLLELMATVRPGRYPRWPGVRASRSVAARVIAHWTLLAALLVRAGGPPSPAPLPTIADAVSTPVPVLATSGSASPTAAAVPARPADRLTEIEVGRRDTLWGLAEHHLRSGARWELLRDANVGRVMPDGTRLAPGFTQVRPGWRLIVPRLQPEPVTSGAVGRPAATTVVVEQGDTLWRLSSSHLAVAGAQPSAAVVAGYVADIAAANQDVIPDPDLIFPGQQILLPEPDTGLPALTAVPDPVLADERDGAGPMTDDGRDGAGPAADDGRDGAGPAADDGRHDAPGPDSDGGTGTAGPGGHRRHDAAGPDGAGGPEEGVGPVPADAADPADGSAGHDGWAGEPGAPSPTNSQGRSWSGPEPASGPAIQSAEVDAAARPTGDQPASGTDAVGRPGDDDREAVGLGLGAGLLAAGALSLLYRRRRYRMAHRRPHTVPADPDPVLRALERDLNRSADPSAAAWLARALGSLAIRPVWEGEPVAQPLLARYSEAHIDVEFTHQDPMGAPLPWVTADGGTTWRLSRDQALPEVTPTPGAAAPLLVTVGHGTLLNLEAAGVVSLVGSGDGALGMVRSFVHELATSSSGPLIDIRTTFPIEGVASYDLVRVCSPASLLAELLPWLDDVAGVLRRTGAVNAHAHRLAGTDEPVGPVLVVADGAARHQLEPLIGWASVAALPFAVVLVGDQAETGVLVRVEGDTAVVHPWDLRVTAQRLDREQAEQLGGLLAQAAAPDAEPLVTGLRLSASVAELRTRRSGPAPAAPAEAIELPRPTASPDTRPEPPPDTEVVLGTPPDEQPDAAVVSSAPAEQPDAAMGADVPLDLAPDAIGDPRPDRDAGHPVVAAGAAAAGASEQEREAEALPAVDLAGGARPAPRVSPAARPLRLRLLGPVEIEGPIGPELTSQQLSLITYLACNGPSTRAVLIDALWDGQLISNSRFPNLLAETRARIGRHHLPEARDGRYQLVDVVTDLDEFDAAMVDANRDRALALPRLRAALALVRGVPFTVPSGRFWSWAGDQTHVAARVESTVADTAARLARLELDAGNVEGAVAACERGLVGSPTDETLVTLLAGVYVSSGRLGTARRLVEAWEGRIAAMDCGEPSDGPRRQLLAG